MCPPHHFGLREKKTPRVIVEATQPVQSFFACGRHFVKVLATSEATLLQKRFSIQRCTNQAIIGASDDQSEQKGAMLFLKQILSFEL